MKDYYRVLFLSQFIQSNNLRFEARVFPSELRLLGKIQSSSSATLSVPINCFENIMWGISKNIAPSPYYPLKNDICLVFVGSSDNDLSLVFAGTIAQQPIFSTEENIFTYECVSLIEKGINKGPTTFNRKASGTIQNGQELIEALLQEQARSTFNMTMKNTFSQKSQDILRNSKIGVNYTPTDTLASIRSQLLLNNSVFMSTTYDYNFITQEIICQNNFDTSIDIEDETYLQMRTIDGELQYTKVAVQPADVRRIPSSRQYIFTHSIKNGRIGVASDVFFNFSGLEGYDEYKAPLIMVAHNFSGEKWKTIKKAFNSATSSKQVAGYLLEIKEALNKFALMQTIKDAYNAQSLRVTLASTIKASQECLTEAGRVKYPSGKIWQVGDKVIIDIIFNGLTIQNQKMIVLGYDAVIQGERIYTELILGFDFGYSTQNITDWTLPNAVKQALLDINTNFAKLYTLSFNPTNINIADSDSINRFHEARSALITNVFNQIRKNPENREFKKQLLLLKPYASRVNNNYYSML